MSFETAAKRMSADVLSFSAGSSSVNKGESLRDTVETVEAIGIDSVIIRHASSGVPARVAEWVDRCVVINAGDGWHQHPTQALLDLYTVRQAFGGGDEGLAGFEGTAGGHRRATSATAGWPGRRSRPTRPWAPRSPWWRRPRCCRRRWPDGRSPPSPIDLDDVLPKVDVVSLLRVQSERGSGQFVPTLREYTAGYGLTARRATMLQPGAVILHPGPIIRGVEIASDVAELPASLITEQVSNGVAIRMAVLFLLLGQGPVEGADRA